MKSNNLTIQTVERSLNNIDACCSSLLLETNFNLDDDTFSWPNYSHGVLSSLTYVGEYQRLIDNKQFSFLLIDKSFFQFFFDFDGVNLKSAKLCYYPAPVKISGAIDELYEVAEASGIDLIEEFYFGAEEWINRGIDLVNTSHFRLDYDPRATSHSQCHVQFGGINELRIPSRVLINPFIFFDWICKCTGMAGFKDICNKPSYGTTFNYNIKRKNIIESVDNKIPHIVQ